MVFTNVPFVRQQSLNTVVGKLLITVGGHATVVQPVHQLLHGRAIVVPLKGFHHKGGFQRVNLKELFLVHLEAIQSLNILPERCALVESEPERTQGLRQMLVDNYSVFYIVGEDTVSVARVLYSASDLVRRLRRMK